ncbi:hypothetical protein [Motilibacter deserti]|uniref:DUF4325 domain-containing protein n=1 Tax=Motilibacter deserti TaxID=2714956 RepID=A0ABX0GSJ9_9ACTN|nr:hypothetical protein [Motilibacter deserti]NHC12819.1 hypothetical protein [Motilibacter deserti]
MEITLDHDGGRPSVLPTPRPVVTTSAPSIVTHPPLQVRRRVVLLGPDGDGPLVRQRIAEAVRMTESGSVVVIDSDGLTEVSPDLVDFLRFADGAVQRRGGTLAVEPADGTVARQLRDAL